MANFTKKAIIETFIIMLNEMPLDKITVKDIVDKCDINRNTFYYYYHDVYELLEDIISQEIDKVVNNATTSESWIEGCKNAMQFSIDNKRAIYHIYNSISREELYRYLNTVIAHFMGEYIKQEIEDLHVSSEDILLISTFYRSAIVGLILEWLSEGMKEDAIMLFDRLGKILGGSVKESLVRASCT